MKMKKNGAIAALALLLVATATLMTGSTPNARKEMGTRYRWTYFFEGSATDSVLVRFPKFADVIPVSADSIRAATWIHVSLKDPALSRVIIWSPAFPAGVDTMRMHQDGTSLTFGGCRIDSVRLCVTSGADLDLLATD
jgi:hypothetical protein